MNITRKQLIAAFLILVTVIGLITAIWLVNRNKPGTTSQQPDSPTQTSAQQDGVNLDPPTDADKKEVDNHKNQLADKLDNPQSNQPATTTKPYLTRAEHITDPSVNKVEAAGYVSSVIEDGGSCRYTFSGSATEVTRESKGFKDARTTVCPPVSIPRAEFGAPGTWKVKLTYNSTTVSGTSDEQSIDIK